jgi:hypothetical protein
MTIDASGSTREEVHTLNLYEPELVLECLADSGFVAENLDRYCDFSFWPGYAAFAALR